MVNKQSVVGDFVHHCEVTGSVVNSLLLVTLYITVR